MFKVIFFILWCIVIILISVIIVFLFGKININFFGNSIKSIYIKLDVKILNIGLYHKIITLEELIKLEKKSKRRKTEKLSKKNFYRGSNNLQNEILRLKSTKKKFIKQKYKREQKLMDRLVFYKDMNIKMYKCYFNIKLDTPRSDFTAYMVSVLAILFSNLLSWMNKIIELHNVDYKVTPIYQNNLQVYFDIDCIISIKIVDIINAIYLSYKRRKKDNDG